MKAIKCEMCGSNDVLKIDGYYMCKFCGTKYTVDEAKKLLVEVKIDNSERLSNIYNLARRAREEGNIDNAAKYYEMILLEEPNNWEANFFSSYFTALNTTIANISYATNTVSKSAVSSLELIKQNISNEVEINTAVMEILSAVIHFSGQMYEATMKHYKQFNDVDGSGSEKCDRVNSIIFMLFETGDAIERLFYDNELLCENAKDCWKLAFSCYENTVMIAPTGMSEHLEKIRKYEPNYTPKKHVITSASGGCFIATSVYGSYDCPEVWVLRRYRDYSLSKKAVGRLFIKVYYALSPKIVKYFGNMQWFNKLFKTKLDLMVKELKTQGFSDRPYIDK